MCGIVGYTGKKKAAPILLEGLERLEYRGYDSVGIAVIDENETKILKDKGRIESLRKASNNANGINGTIGIGHSRWATHGAPTAENAHPHFSQNRKFSVVHNGIIENFAYIKAGLTARGFHFVSETDTETVAHLLELNDNGNFKETVQKTLRMLEGSYALGIINREQNDVLYAARKTSPLIIGLGDGENYIASDVTALIKYTRQVIYLEDNEFAEVSSSGVTVFDLDGNTVDKEIKEIDWDIESAEKGGYEHFMLKEIFEQPKVIKATVDTRIKNGRIVFDNFSMSAEEIKNINRIIITACGSASYAGQLGKIAIERLARIPTDVCLASELRYSNPIIDENTLLVAVSQSGETADTIAAIKEAKSRGARIVSIVNVIGSTIARLSDDLLITAAGPEIAVATTKGYTTQAALLYLFALYLANKQEKISSEMYQYYIDEISRLSLYSEKALEINTDLSEIAKKYADSKNIFFIGRDTDYAVCMEASLKLKEISYIHSEAFAAGELKHGTISLIDEGTPVVALCCREELYDKMRSNIKEVKARGARILLVVPEGADLTEIEPDDVIYVPRTDFLVNGSVEIIPMQLFAYYVAKHNGCDIDKPKNLAKSVTVE